MNSLIKFFCQRIEQLAKASLFSASTFTHYQMDVRHLKSLMKDEGKEAINQRKKV